MPSCPSASPRRAEQRRATLDTDLAHVERHVGQPQAAGRLGQIPACCPFASAAARPSETVSIVEASSKVSGDVAASCAPSAGDDNDCARRAAARGAWKMSAAGPVPGSPSIHASSRLSCIFDLNRTVCAAQAPCASPPRSARPRAALSCGPW